MHKIKHVHARQILDSRGNPTLEVEIVSDDSVLGRGAVPSGASTGEFEACELRDADPQVYLGKGVLQAVNNVNSILKPQILGFPLGEQKKFDDLLCEADGTSNKSKLGANTLLGLSMAYAQASAQAQKLELYSYFAQLSGHKQVSLPVPMMNILNGGAHADNTLDFQEIMIMPVRFESFSRALQAGVEIFHHLKAVIKSYGLNTAVGDEGGFAPNVDSPDQALDFVAEAVKRAGYKLGQDVFLALDVAASEFYKNGHYVLKSLNNKVMSAENMIEYYKSLVEKYPIISIEDGLDQNDWSGWQALTKALGHKVQLVGDDLFVTNTQLLKKGIDQKIANAVLVKMNQIGTITETVDCITLAQAHGYNTIISHRSGETEDTMLADLAVGTHAGQIKTGSLCRTDRVAKYNQLLRIEDKLGASAHYSRLNGEKKIV